MIEMILNEKSIMKMDKMNAKNFCYKKKQNITETKLLKVIYPKIKLN